MEDFRSRRIADINNSLSRTRRAIVTTGCSFAYGKGAYDEELLADLMPRSINDKWGDWDYNDAGHDPKLLESVAKKHNLVYDKQRNTMHTTAMECNNSFVSQLCENNLANEYTPINFGASGKGNMGSIERMFYYDINWEDCDEIIVVWMPTDLARCDISGGGRQDFTMIGSDTDTLFPTNIELADITNARQAAEYGYTNELLMQNPIEQKMILKCYKLLTQWCLFHNAKLVIFPGFRPLPTPEEMFNGLAPESTIGHDELKAHLRRHIPTDKIIEVDGRPTFGHWILKLEGVEGRYDMHDVVHNKTVSIDYNYLTPCGHPNKKSHGMLADHLETLFESRGWI